MDTLFVDEKTNEVLTPTELYVRHAKMMSVEESQRTGILLQQDIDCLTAHAQAKNNMTTE